MRSKNSGKNSRNSPQSASCAYTRPLNMKLPSPHPSPSGLGERVFDPKESLVLASLAGGNEREKVYPQNCIFEAGTESTGRERITGIYHGERRAQSFQQRELNRPCHDTAP